MVYKILVVDDEPAVRELFKDLFKKEGHSVKAAATGEESLELVEKEDFDIILMDIKLTGINGLEALKKIKALKSKIIVIMITGFGYDEELISKSREYGSAGYIGKNMPISQIISNFNLFVKAAKKEIKNA
jgi:CheY-like chemotaxis protein